MPQIRPHQGLTIDGFTLGPMLHKGGFATLWDVTHPDHPTPLIMKVPTILDGDDAPTIVGFEVEQMILPRLSGPHVPRLFAIGDFATMPYIVTEFLPGGSLLRSFERGPRSLSTILEKSARMVQAVAALHAQLVIHLDLKPANFLQRPTGEIVCIDFGLARHDQLPDLLAEEFTIPMGTYPYLAPEQYLRQRNDPRSDLFALGAMIYELATGQMPFGQPQTLRQVRKRLWRDPVPPRALRPDLPEWLQEIILRALSVDPRRRYQTAAQMAFDLEHPAQVPLTARARKTRQDGWWTLWQRKRRMARLSDLGDPPRLSVQGHLPILLVAVDLSPDMEPLADQLRQALGRMLDIQPDTRVVCVNVIKTARLGIDQMTDAEGNNLHVTRLVNLRHWAEGIDLPQERLSFTVLEHPDPADALIEHAQKIRANHILMGARGSGGARRYLGSVSAKVVAEAECSVTVMRVMGQGISP